MSKRRGRKAKRNRVTNPNGNRTETTRKGRQSCQCRSRSEYLVCPYRFGCPGPDLVVSDLKKHRMDMTTREDLPVTPLAVLYGRGVLDRRLYDAGLYYQAVLTLWRHGANLNEGSVAAIYDRLMANPDRTSAPSADLGRTIADSAKDEVLAMERGMAERQIGLARSVVNGDWHGSISAIVAGRVTYAAVDSGGIAIQTGADTMRPEHHRALIEIRGAFAALAKHPQRLRAATLAA